MFSLLVGATGSTPVLPSASTFGLSDFWAEAFGVKSFSFDRSLVSEASGFFTAIVSGVFGLLLVFVLVFFFFDFEALVSFFSSVLSLTAVISIGIGPAGLALGGANFSSKPLVEAMVESVSQYASSLSRICLFFALSVFGVFLESFTAISAASSTFCCSSSRFLLFRTAVILPEARMLSLSCWLLYMKYNGTAPHITPAPGFITPQLAVPFWLEPVALFSPSIPPIEPGDVSFPPFEAILASSLAFSSGTAYRSERTAARRSSGRGDVDLVCLRAAFRLVVRSTTSSSSKSSVGARGTFRSLTSALSPTTAPPRTAPTNKAPQFISAACCFSLVVLIAHAPLRALSIKAAVSSVESMESTNALVLTCGFPMVEMLSSL
mmetsp:Transcript_3025/g.7108  ORF Transcript_3025/g.7108 Transcript_3025/m.7108 type:complete len:378 (-) Transcript_3025:928-2061(-)